MQTTDFFLKKIREKSFHTDRQQDFVTKPDNRSNATLLSRAASINSFENIYYKLSAG
jgi:hypothetical protein